MPATPSSLITVPARELSAALDGGGARSRCCLREWLRLVPDPRKPSGRWHPLDFVLALVTCAFTATGHDSPSAVAEWACGRTRDTAEEIAAMGGYYLQVIKASQPSLPEAVTTRLTGTGDQFPGWREEGKGHGRRERRSIRTAPADGIDWPQASQVFRIRRGTGPACGPWESREFATTSASSSSTDTPETRQPTPTVT